MPRTRTVAAIAACLIGTLGCADKAKPDFDKCVALEGRGELDEAVSACRAAGQADPASKAGAAASAKIPTLEAAVVKKKGAAEAKKKVEEQRAREAERVAQFATKVRFRSNASSEVNMGVSICGPEHKPPVWATCWDAAKDGTNGDKEACDAVARGAGCVPEDKGYTWCCPRGVLGLP